jgi:DNA polymerase/3'-5' exonuclease PolX
MQPMKTNSLQQIPGIGPNIEKDLNHIGIYTIDDLKNKDPEVLYGKLIKQVGKPVDRCVLYVFRLAVYYASQNTHDPERLKWWNWKD